MLIPALARGLDIDLDKAGITVCAINGTHFGSYARFCAALAIPWAIVTDGDPDADGTLHGERRGADLQAALPQTGNLPESGIFVGTETFEYDLAVASDGNTAMACPCSGRYALPLAGSDRRMGGPDPADEGLHRDDRQRRR